jgi:aryl-alcohol dehydrogenase-like predicted oxidoreductase
VKYRKLGSSDVEVSVLCLGTWEFGQSPEWGHGNVADYGRVINSALDAGVNFIDTAELYGESEEILGELLKGRRSEVVLATKIGGYEWDYNTMRKKLEQSLRRLKTDYVDLFQIHWPKIKGIDHGLCTSNMEDQDYENITFSLTKLREEGLIRMGGVSNFRLHHLQKFQEAAFNVIICNQIPYSLLWRPYDDPSMVEFCKSRRLSYLTYSSLAVGLLSGKFVKRSAFSPAQRANVLFNEPLLDSALKVVKVVCEVASESGATPSQVALKWVIDRELTASALVGTRNARNFEEDIDAVDLQLERDQVARLDKASEEFASSIPPQLEMWSWDNTAENLTGVGITT